MPFGTSLETKIYPFTFNEEAHIKIPKYAREIAYAQFVDIEVQSVIQTLYKNYKITPESSFFGYAVLVFQDELTIEVPLHQPRQRIWTDYQWDAFRSWQDFRARLSLNEQIRAAVAPLYGENPDAYQTIPFEGVSFVELPLREVHVRGLDKSSFHIIYSQVQPVAYTDIGGNTYNGASGQTDGVKDNGLPSEGIQPRQNDPSNPFANNSNLGIPTPDNGFYLPSTNLTLPNPAVPDDFGWFAEISGVGWKAGCNGQFYFRLFYLLAANESVSIRVDDATVVCGTGIGSQTILGNGGRVIAAGFGSVVGLTARVIRSADLPPNIVIDL
jgi:hypothetical protein